MTLFAHHMQSFIDIEIMGHELTPSTATEHALFLAVAVGLLFFLGYGVFASIRDFLRWRRRGLRSDR